MGGVIFFFMRRGKSGGGSSKPLETGIAKESSTVQTFVYAFEASGLFSVVKPDQEEATHIAFKYGGQEWNPKKTNPFTPAGSQARIFEWPVGADSCLDPQFLHGNRDMDDPESLIQEATHWFRSIRAAIGSLGVSLKNPFLILLLVVTVLGSLAAGYILGNTNPIHP